MKGKKRNWLLGVMVLGVIGFVLLFGEIAYASTDNDPVANPVYDQDTDGSTYSYVYFGSYPQSEIKGEALTDSIKNAKYNSNGDVVVNGEKIRREKRDNTYKYFLYEPIRWQVLEVNNQYLYLLSDKILDRVDFGGNNWKASSVRSWLNGYTSNMNSAGKDYTKKGASFYSMAFSENQAEILQLISNTVNNKSTEDYIAYLSTADVMSTKYGFAADGYGSNTRIKKSSDYIGNYKEWNLIDGYYINEYEDGDISEDIYYWENGVCPCIKVLANSDEWSTIYPDTEYGTNISECSAFLDYSSVSYNGKAKQPGVIVEDDYVELEKNIDYLVSYSNNTNAGTATVTITGTGDYYGTLKKTFKINPISQTISGVVSSYKKVMGETAFRLNPKTTGDGRFSYGSNNKAVAIVSETTGKITITGIGTAKITITAQKTTNYKAATKTVTVTVYPKKAAGLKASAADKSSIKLSWSKVSGVSGYIVYKYSETQETYQKIKTITSGNITTYTCGSLKASKGYFFKVCAYKKISSGNLYGEKSAAIKMTTLPEQVVIKSVSAKSGKITAKWGAKTSTGYQMQYSTSSKFTSGVKTISSTATSKTTSTLTTGKKYYVRVRAYRKYNEKMYYGTWSKVVSCQVPKVKVKAKTIYYSGQYSKTIDYVPFYICLNKYSDGSGEGNIYIYEGEGSLYYNEYEVTGEIKKVSTNKYKCKLRSGTLTFTVQNKSLKVKQTGTIIKYVNLSGTYGLDERYRPS